MNAFDRNAALIRSTRLIKLSQIAASALFLCSLSAVAAVPSAFADQDDCTSGTGTGTLRCLSPKLAEARKRLQESYDRVLQKTPKTAFDERKTAQQLEKAQAAWEAYAKENCTYIGGLRGGSSPWVSVFATLCLIKEVDSRTEFLNHLPSGG